MTKSVELGTVEHGLREAYRHLGLPQAAAAIEAYAGMRKSESLLRKYADPDDSRHQVSLRNALAIDWLVLRMGTNHHFRRPILICWKQPRKWKARMCRKTAYAIWRWRWKLPPLWLQRQYCARISAVIAIATGTSTASKYMPVCWS